MNEMEVCLSQGVMDALILVRQQSSSSVWEPQVEEDGDLLRQEESHRRLMAVGGGWEEFEAFGSEVPGSAHLWKCVWKGRFVAPS